jgi:hypothetical protein
MKRWELVDAMGQAGKKLQQKGDQGRRGLRRVHTPPPIRFHPDTNDAAGIL